MPPDLACIGFDVPDGRLTFGPGDLDLWAEHLTWCYRLMGIRDGATIAVQDFGASPLSFLGSSALMPTLEAGVAERLKGRMICLDASRDRVTLTPAVTRQVALDALIVRAEVLGLLVEVSEKSGLKLGEEGPSIIIAFDQDPPSFAGDCRTLLHIESALLLAPECRTCGYFHLRAGFYDLVGDRVSNLRLASARPHSLRLAEKPVRDHCPSGRHDWGIRLSTGDPL